MTTGFLAEALVLKAVHQTGYIALLCMSVLPQILLSSKLAQRMKKTSNTWTFLTNLSVHVCIGARRFPGLINCTSVDFFHPWPRQALISVAARFLDDVELGEASVKESLAVHMAEEHLSVTKV